MELRPAQMQQTTINSEYGIVMKNPDRDTDDCKTKQDYANASFHLKLNSETLTFSSH